MKKLKIDVSHNRDGFDEYNKIAFDYDKPFIIEFIENIKKNLGIIPRINEVLVLEVCKNTDDEDIAVYHIKSIEYYNFGILFILEDDPEIDLLR